jgi:hypothetical protein
VYIKKKETNFDMSQPGIPSFMTDEPVPPPPPYKTHTKNPMRGASIALVFVALFTLLAAWLTSNVVHGPIGNGYVALIWIVWLLIVSIIGSYAARAYTAKPTRIRRL